MLIVNVFNPTLYEVWFAGLPYKKSGAGNQEGKTLKEWCISEKADICFNLALFAMPNAINKRNGNAYHTVNYVKAKGNDIGYGGAEERVKVNWANVCGGQKAIVKDNEVFHTSNKDSRAKNFVGITNDGRFVQIQSYKLSEVAAIRKSTEIIKKEYSTFLKILMLEDGGGSVGCYSNISKTLFAPQKEGTDGRKVSSVVCIRRKELFPKISRTLKSGCKGEDVKLYQQIINCVEIDGSFGNATRNQTKVVQKELGLTVDGVAGPATLSALGLR